MERFRHMSLGGDSTASEMERLFILDDDELPNDAIAFKVVGNCMAPDFIDQDYIVCDPHASPKEGDIVAFHHCRKGFLVKRLVTIEGEHYFKANDTDISPIKVSPECKIAGKVVKVVRSEYTTTKLR